MKQDRRVCLGHGVQIWRRRAAEMTGRTSFAVANEIVVGLCAWASGVVAVVGVITPTDIVTHYEQEVWWRCERCTDCKKGDCHAK
jgi:hypothetical protein